MTKVIKIVIIFISLLLLTVTIRGRSVDLVNNQSSKDTSPGGPYEGSNNTSRYALTEAIVNNRTFFLTPEQARFGAPDVAQLYGRYFTVFTPGISFLGIPLYFLGQRIDLPQTMAYLTVTLLSVLNVFLVYKLAKRFTESGFTALLCGFLFLFATNALAYSNTYTQHHAATAIILSSLLAAFAPASFASAVFMGFLVGAGALVDIPVVIALLPVLIYFVFRYLSVILDPRKLKLSFNLGILGLVLGVLPLFALFGWYNYRTTRSFTTLAQSVGRAAEFDAQRLGLPDASSPKSRIPLPYSPRKLVRGLYILIVSNERGWFYYSPIVAFGIAGLVLAVKNKSQSKIAVVSIGVITAFIVPYSMFGDPWGGWAFGPRYLIPASAIACAFIAPFLENLRRKWLFAAIFLPVAFYSAYLSSLGALTTNLVPPKIEVENIPDHIPYTPQYNRQLLAKNTTGSLVYNLFLNQFLSANTLHIYFTAASCLVIGILYLSLNLRRHAA